MTHDLPRTPESPASERTHTMEDTRNKLELALWFAAAVVALIYTYLM